MAAFEIFFFQALPQCIRSSSSQKNLLFRLYSSSSSSSSSSCSSIRNVGFPKFFSSSPSSSDPPSDNQSELPSVDSSRKPPPTASVTPVSYAVKPVDPSSAKEATMPLPQRTPRRLRDDAFSRSPETDSESATASEPRPWTREDIRYVKDVPSISPVSYPTRVAPLPEDRVSASAEDDAQKEDEKNDIEQLEKEKRRIEAEARFRRTLKIEEETVSFPTLIMVEKKKKKVVLDLQEAIKGVKANAKSNFNETVEAHVNLGVDPRRGDQMVRGATTLPHGTGKTVRVAVFAEGAVAEEARAAGADLVGGDELIEEIKNGGGKLSFDKCISTPTFMPRLGKIARILGPRGMMPNPKLGSVTSDVATAVKEAKRGRIDFKIDKTAIVHVGLGKVSFPEDSLRENIGAFVNALLLAKPVGLKKTSKYAGYVNNFTLSSTMGPGFPVSIQSLSIAADQYNKQQQLK